MSLFSAEETPSAATVYPTVWIADTPSTSSDKPPAKRVKVDSVHSATTRFLSDGASSSFSTAVNDFDQYLSAPVDAVKDYVERAVEVKTQESREEEADRDRRKTNVILHGLPESPATDSDMRQIDDIGILTTMLQEINCDEVQIKQAIRLGKPSNNGHPPLMPNHKVSKNDAYESLQVYQLCQYYEGNNSQ